MSLITLINQHLDPVIWRKSVLCDFSLNNEIDIWQIDVSSNLSRIDDLLNILEPQEIIRANKYLKESSRNRFIISRGSLRSILSGYLKQPAESLRFRLAANNKPFIADLGIDELHFNLSDSADKILIAVARSPVGIDIELVKPNFRYHDILSNNFSIPEAEYIKLCDNHKRFFLLWTRKEAILKATGIGLTDHLKQIPSLNGEHLMDGNLLATNANWRLSSFEASGDYVATIAMDIPLCNLRFWDYTSK